MEQDLLEILWDSDYLAHSHDFGENKSYENYKKIILSQCLPPNKFFADYPEFLYQNINGKKHCLLSKYTTSINENLDLIDNYLDECLQKNQGLECSSQLLTAVNKLSSLKLTALEPLLKTNLEQGILKILAKKEDYQPSEWVVNFLFDNFEEFLNKGLFKNPLEILEKYFIHNKNSGLDEKLFSLVENKKIDDFIKTHFFNKVLNDLNSGKLHLSSKVYANIERDLFAKYKISLTKNIDEEKLAKLVILFMGVAKGYYVASDKLLPFAEKFAEAESPELSDPAISCVWKMYKDIIEAPAKKHLLTDINKKLINFFTKGYKIPKMVLEVSLQRFEYFSELFLKLVVEKELPEKIWPEVEGVILKTLGDKALTAVPLLQSLFILKRVFERDELTDPKALSTLLLPFIFNDLIRGEQEKFREILIDYYHAMCGQVALEGSDVEKFFRSYFKLHERLFDYYHAMYGQVALKKSNIEKFFDLYLNTHNKHTLAKLADILSMQKLSDDYQQKLALYQVIKKGQATGTTLGRLEFINEYGASIAKSSLIGKTSFCISELAGKNDVLLDSCYSYKKAEVEKIYQESSDIWQNNYTSRFILNTGEAISLEKNLAQIDPQIIELLQKIDFLRLPDLLNFLDTILDKQIRVDQLISIFSDRYYTAKEAYELINQLLFKQEVGKIFALEKFRPEEKSFWLNINKALKLGWQLEGFLKQLSKIKVENNKEVQAFIGEVEYIASYEISPFLYDHEFNYAKEILQLDNDKWLPKLQQIISDNSFYFTKKQQILLKELEESNKHNIRINKLIKDGYFKGNLDNIAEIKLVGELPINKKPLSDWQKEDFLNWRASIQKIDDNNISEVLAVLNQAVKSVRGFYLREAQLLSVLSLFKSPTGGLAEIATGEGKSLIIAAFAALKVIAGHEVDVVTSSKVLAERDSDGQRKFYELLGISVAHNIDGHVTATGSKECYQADVVYGDMLYLVGDALRDITHNIKEGRSFDILVVDEADSLFIDNTDMMVQLASPMPGFEMFKAVQLYSWFNTGFKARTIEQNATDGKCYEVIDESIPLKGFNASLLNITALNDTQNSNFNYTEIIETLNKEYAKYNNTEFDSAKKENATLTRVLLGGNCADYLGEYNYNFTRDYLLDTFSLSKKNILIPKHLMHEGPKHLQAWSDSLVSAVFYNKEDVDYLVYDNYGPGQLNNLTIISPIDRDTGTLQTSMQWSAGLHQYLQLKHHLAMTSENLISTFNSYPGFFKKYKGNIFGLTGTTGNTQHHNFMKSIYGVEVSVIPTFIHKDTYEFGTSVVSNETDWLSLIASSAERRILEGRAVLIIVPTLEEVKNIYYKLSDSDYLFKDKIKIYGRGLLIEEKLIEDPMQAGDIIIATNLAGRGTDLQLSKQVIKAGGLHVILGYLSESERVEKQAFGRAARKGEPGSVQVILNNEALITYKDCSYGDITCLKEEYAAEEIKHLKDLAYCKLPMTFARDELFNQYVEFLTAETSPTKYKIILSKPLIKLGKDDFDDEVEEQLAVPEKNIYLYQNKGILYLHIIKNDQTGEIEKEVNLNELANFLDPKVEKHLKAVFSKAEYSASSLSKQDYEFINFLAAYKGFSDNPIILLRSEYKLFFLAAKHYYDQKNNNNLSPQSVNELLDSTPRAEAEQLYLTHLLLTDESYAKFKAELPLDEKGAIKEISAQILTKVKLSFYYAGWLEDRALYHKEYEIMQMNELFAHWLFEHKIIHQHARNCNAENGWTNWITDGFLGTVADNKLKIWLKRFEHFKQDISTWHASGKLLQNPAYVIYKAWHLLSVEDEMQAEKSQLGIGTRKEEGKKYALQYKKHLNYYDYLKEFKSEFPWVSDWQQSDGNYLIQDPMNLAVALLEAELKQKDAYAKFALYNTLSFIRLIKDGRGIWSLKHHGAKASDVMMRFKDDSAEALQAINDELAPHYQGQLNYMLINGLAKEESDLTLQLIGTIELYKKINETIYNNLLKLQSNNGKQMIRVGKNIDIEILADSINITRAVEETFNYNDLTNETRHNLMEVFNGLELKSKSLITTELTNMGVLLFEIELYDLKEPKKHWWKTALVGALGVLQIVGGIALMGAGTPFLSMLGMGMAFSGIGDVLSSIQSFATKTPIDLSFYVKSKAMSYAITITLAGLGAAFDGSSIGGLNNWGAQAAKALDKGVTNFLLKGFAINGLMMAAQPMLAKLADRAVDKNKGNLEASAWRRVSNIFAEHSLAFKRIYVGEILLQEQGYGSSLLKAAQDIVHEENKRFKNDGMNYAVGVASGVAGYAFGGISWAGFTASRVVDAGLHGILGGVKSIEVLDRSAERLGNKVEEIAASVPKTAKLMEMRLHAQRDTKVLTVSRPLMAVLEAEKFVDGNGEINYKDCRRIESIKFADTYAQYMQALVEACEEINKAMSIEEEPVKSKHAQWLYHLQRHLQQVLAGGITHIMKQDVVKPQVDIWVGGLIKDAGDKLYDKLKELFTSHKPQTVTTTQPGEGEGKEKTNKFKPKRPQAEASQSHTGGGKGKAGGKVPRKEPVANDNPEPVGTKVGPEQYGPPCPEGICGRGGYGEAPKNPTSQPQTVEEVLRNAKQDAKLDSNDQKKLEKFAEDVSSEKPEKPGFFDALANGWNKLWGDFEEARIRKMGEKYRKLADKYEKFAQENPELAKYGLSAIIVAAKGLATGGAGLIPALGQEGVGHGAGEVINKYFGKDIAAGIKWQQEEFKAQLLREHPSLSEREAANYAELKVAAMIGAVGGASLLRDVLKIIKLNKLHSSTHIPDHELKPELKGEFGDGVNKGLGGSNIKWSYWSDYEKVVVNGKEYAKVGDYLYTRHAIENLYPTSMGMAPGHTSNHYPINVSPKFVNDVLASKEGVVKTHSVNFPNRIQHDVGDIRIITEGNIIITVMRTK